MTTSSTNDYAATGCDCESKEWLEAKVTNGFTRVYAEGSLGAVAGLTYTVLSAPTVGSPMSGRVIISETAASVGGEGGPAPTTASGSGENLAVGQPWPCADM